MNGVLVCEGQYRTKNIGDYLQSVAQEQFFDKVDCYVEREEINSFNNDETTNVIMNAWWMRNPENFPPSSIINPLFISFHLVPSISDRFFTRKTIDYLKKYEPIGARDYSTMQIIEKYGIKSFYSGCLTLTLGMKYKKDHPKRQTIIFVDPYYELFDRNSNFLCSFFSVIKSVILNYKSIKRIYPKFVSEFHTKISKISRCIDKFLHCAAFVGSYKSFFSVDLLEKALFISHNILQADYPTNKDKMEYAKMLINTYADAKLVVTSRIHCALPCLGVETPVLFVNSEKLENGSLRSPGRFGGIIELFHQLKWTNNGVEVVSETLKDCLIDNKITLDSRIQNSKQYVPIRDNLISIVKSFISKNN